MPIRPVFRLSAQPISSQKFTKREALLSVSSCKYVANFQSNYPGCFTIAWYWLIARSLIGVGVKHWICSVGWRQQKRQTEWKSIHPSSMQKTRNHTKHGTTSYSKHTDTRTLSTTTKTDYGHVSISQSLMLTSQHAITYQNNYHTCTRQA